MCLAVVLGAFLLFGRAPITTYVTIGAVVALVVVCLLTGTAPG